MESVSVGTFMVLWSGGLNRRNFVVHELLTIIPNNEKRFGGLGNVRHVAELERLKRFHRTSLLKLTHVLVFVVELESMKSLIILISRRRRRRQGSSLSASMRLLTRKIPGSYTLDNALSLYPPYLNLPSPFSRT